MYSFFCVLFFYDLFFGFIFLIFVFFFGFFVSVVLLEMFGGGLSLESLIFDFISCLVGVGSEMGVRVRVLVCICLLLSDIVFLEDGVFMVFFLL